jgi:hypothetical protein
VNPGAENIADAYERHLTPGVIRSMGWAGVP